MYLRQQGYDQEIIRLSEAGTPIVGICGGYQMLGKEIHDPEHTESHIDQVEALGLLDTVTVFAADKITHQVTARCSGDHGFLGMNYQGVNLQGYENSYGTDRLPRPGYPRVYDN